VKPDFEIDNGKVKLIIYFTYPFAFLCSILYLYAFWSTFNINFLEHISLSDILKISAYPLFLVIFFFLLGLLYNTYLDVKAKSHPPEKRQKSKESALKVAIFVLYLFIGNITYTIGPVYLLWAVIPILITSKFRNILKNNVLSNKLFKGKVSVSISLIIIIIPYFSFAQGKINSHNMLNNFEVRYVKTIQFKEGNLFEEQLPIKYVGLGGSHYFFLSDNNSNLYIINSNNLNLIELNKPTSEKFVRPMDKLTDWYKKERPLDRIIS